MKATKEMPPNLSMEVEDTDIPLRATNVLFEDEDVCVLRPNLPTESPEALQSSIDTRKSFMIRSCVKAWYWDQE